MAERVDLDAEEVGGSGRVPSKPPVRAELPSTISLTSTERPKVSTARLMPAGAQGGQRDERAEGDRGERAGEHGGQERPAVGGGQAPGGPRAEPGEGHLGEGQLADEPGDDDEGQADDRGAPC